MLFVQRKLDEDLFNLNGDGNLDFEVTKVESSSCVIYISCYFILAITHVYYRTP